MKKLLLLLTCFFYIGSILAQDSHYWQSNYGPGGFLTPGSAIAYDHDSGLFYYNPALMAIKGKTSVTISANIYELNSLKIRDGVGSGLNLGKTGYRINPQMLSGTINFKNRKQLTLGYALMRNPVQSFEATQRQDKSMQVLDDSYSPGNETYVGQYYVKNIINTTTVMAGAGLKLDEHWAIGLTGEVHILSQDVSEQISSRALVNTTDTAVYFQPLVDVQSSYLADYWHVGLRFKGGVSYNSGIHHLGLVVNSPMISIRGRATLASDIVISNLWVPNTGGVQLNLLANGRQTKIPVTYKMPLSLALGYAVDYGKGQIYVAGEYFCRVGNYNILTPRNIIFIRPDTGTNRATNTEVLQMREERKSILNFAIGASYRLDSNIMFMASFRTDFACNTSETDLEVSGTVPYTSIWDNYHLELGGQVRRKKFNLRTGVMLSYGSTNQFMQPVNFDDPNEDNLMSGTPHTVKASAFTLGILVAYVHNL